MSWSYSVSSKALRQLRKLGSLAEFWSFRIDDYRVIYKIDDGELVVLVVRVEHRRNVYD